MKVSVEMEMINGIGITDSETLITSKLCHCHHSTSDHCIKESIPSKLLPVAFHKLN